MSHPRTSVAGHGTVAPGADESQSTDEACRNDGRDVRRDMVDRLASSLQPLLTWLTACRDPSLPPEHPHGHLSSIPRLPYQFTAARGCPFPVPVLSETTSVALA